MDLLNKIKKLIINNRITIFALLFIAYWILKLYTLYTPSTADDEVPDNIKDAVMTLIKSNNL